MTATASDDKKRHLAQPPGSLADRTRRTRTRRRRFPLPVRVAAVLVVAALVAAGILFLSALPGGHGWAASPVSAAAAAPTTDGPGALVVPILFPLQERVPFTDTFGAARSGGRTHAGNDLMAPKMTPIIAVVDGTLDWMNFTGKLSSYNNLPYYNILLRGDDGNDYFYIHLNNDTPGTDDGQGGPEYAYAPGLTNGSRVEAGQVIGYVGDSGNAEDCESHLHFEIHLGGYVAAGPGQSCTPSAINPYASLKAAPTVAEWIAAGRPSLGGWTTTTTTTTTIAPPTTTTTMPPAPPSTNPPPSTPTTAPGGDTSVPGYTDVRTTDWFYADFAQARAAGVVTETADKRFRPYDRVSRALFAVYLVRAVAPGELEDEAEETIVVGAPRFNDVKSEYWACKEIETAARLGLVKGTGDGSNYSPDMLVTRAQMATMMCRAMGVNLDVNSSASDASGTGGAATVSAPFSDVPDGYWAEEAIAVVNDLGLMVGDTNGHFRPQDSTTRVQAITVMARLLRLRGGGSGL